jgi:tetratricopeptide (TPR) repeat protein
VVTAQDKALATLCMERALLDDAAFERARAAHAEERGRGVASPLAQFLVERQFLAPNVAAGLLRELALATFSCQKCGRAWSYETLASLTRYRCNFCDERLARHSSPSSARLQGGGARFSSAPIIDATAVATAGPRRPSSRRSAWPTTDSGSGDQPLRKKRMIGPYEVLSELGRGAMGIVYLARREGLERTFAVKVLLGGTLANEEAVERFRREAALASRILHPAVVSVCDMGISDNLPYYVMEHCPGKTLKAVLDERGPLETEKAVRFVAEIARGLAAAHALGVVHRDVKPANIIIEEKTGSPRIMDFGLARDAKTDETGMTRTGDVLGTPSYMAPEQLTASRDVDARADVYSLGVVLYELLSGTRPFKADTVAHLAAMVLTEDPKPLRQARPGAPAPLEAVVAKALAKTPAGRYASAADFAADLERFLAGEAVLARPEPWARRVWKRSRLQVVASVVGIAVLGAGGLALRSLLKDRDAGLEQLRVRVAAYERDATKGAPGDRGKDFADERARAPGSALAMVDIPWARMLSRRGQTEAALKRVEPYLDAGGKDGLEAKRIAADALLRQQDPRGKALVATLEASGDPVFANWARLERYLMDTRGEPPAAAMQAVSESSDGPGLRLLAELDGRTGQERKAVDLLERIINEAADDVRARLMRASLLRGRLDPTKLRANEKDAACACADVEAFFRFGGELDRVPEALYERALNAFTERRFADQLHDLEAALDAGVDTIDVNVARSWFGGARGRRCWERARSLGWGGNTPDPSVRDQIEMAMTLTPDLERRLKEVAGSAPEPARTAFEGALLSMARGARVEETLQSFDRAMSIAPESPVIALFRARFLMNAGRNFAAFDAAGAAGGLAKANLSELALLQLEACERGGRRADAEQAARALANGPAGLYAFLARSYLARSSGDFSLAVSLAKKAIEIAPDNGAAHRFLAAALLDGPTDSPPAFAEACIALREDGLLDVHARCLALVASMIPWSGGGGRGGGGNARRQAVRAAWDDLVRDYPTALHYFGRGYMLMLSFSESPLEDFQKAAEAEPESPLGEEGLGWYTSIAKGNEEEGRKHYDRARKIDPRWVLGPELGRLVKAPPKGER